MDDTLQNAPSPTAGPHPNPLPEGEGTRRSAFIFDSVSLALIAFCCVLPILWIVWQIALNPTTLSELHLDRFRLALLGRTILYSICVGIIATLLALPAAWVLGRGRGIAASALWFVLPITLLMPSLVIAYGWSQLIRMLTVWCAQHWHINLQIP